MSVLFIGDLHFQVSNTRESTLFSERILELAEKVKPDVICVGGDLLHTHEKLHYHPLTAVSDLLRDLRKIAITYVLVGNHDAVNNQIFLTRHHWMNVLKEWDNLVVVDTVRTHTINEHKLVFVPYVPPGRFKEALNTVEGWEEADCIFAHQEFRGCDMGGIVSEGGDVWEADKPVVFSGHIHVRQNVGENVVYSGSAFQHAYGEDARNVVLHISLSQSGPTFDEIDLDMPRKRTIKTDVNGLDQIEVPEDAGSNLRIKIQGDAEELKAMKKTKKYRELVKSGVKVVCDARMKEVRPKEVVTEGVDFRNILRELVEKSGNVRLQQIYDNVARDILYA